MKITDFVILLYCRNLSHTILNSFDFVESPLFELQMLNQFASWSHFKSNHFY